MERLRDICIIILSALITIVCWVQIGQERGWQLTWNTNVSSGSASAASLSDTQTIRIQGKLRHGEHLARFLRSTPTIEVVRPPREWISNSSTYDAVGAAYKIDGLEPGRYRVLVKFDEKPLQPFGYPGDYFGEIEVTAESDVDSADIQLTQYMRLLEPFDNAGLAPELGDHCANIRTQHPPRIAWEPVHRAAIYHYKVVARECGNSRNNRLVASGQVRSTNINFPLPPNRPNWYYAVQLKALRDGVPVGELQINGHDWYSWEVKFLVVEE